MVKIGIIGSGFGLYGLLPAFKEVKGCQVVAFCGHDKKRIEEYKNILKDTTIYFDWKQMIDREQLDAVVIAVPGYQQASIAKAAIKKGLHIWAEKPLATSLKEAKELLRLAKKKKIIHTVDFLFPEIPEWQKVKQLLDKKRYGKLTHISLNWNFLSYDIKHTLSSWKTDPTKGGGALSLYFSHSLYYLEYLAGKITSLSSLFTYSKKSKNGGEVGVDLVFKSDSNVTGYAHFSCNTSGVNEHKLTFMCEKATVLLENKGSFMSDFQVTVHAQNKIKKVVLGSSKKKGERDERVKTVVLRAKKFIQAIRRKKQMTPSFEAGVRVQELIEIIRRKTL